jgi:glycosyltransferase involved in cell wall biosynthesis
VPGAVHVVVPGDPEQISGGYAYDRRIAAELRQAGWQVTMHGLEGRFPVVDALATASARACFSALPDGALTVVDGLALGGLPELAAEAARRLRLIALVHHPLADETGLDDATRALLQRRERSALAQAQAVIVTSEFTRRRLAERYAVAPERMTVAPPGTDPAPLARARHDSPPRLLCVGSVIPRKGYAVLLEALARLRHIPWSCRCIGSLEFDPEHARFIIGRSRALGLEDRVHFDGACSGTALEEAYAGASLFVHPSHYEGYGMVLTEAVARGLPVVTTTGGAIPDTLPSGAGLQVPPGDSEALASALGALLHGREARAALARGAIAARADLPTWADAAGRFAAALRSEMPA